MHKGLFYCLGILAFSLFTWSCKKDKVVIFPCPYIEEAPPRYLIAPDSVRTDSTITIGVAYSNQKYCQQLDSFHSTLIDSTMTISIQTKIDSCNCHDQFDMQTPSFKYQAPHQPGHSIIRIHVINNFFYSDTIVVY